MTVLYKRNHKLGLMYRYRGLVPYCQGGKLGACSQTWCYRRSREFYIWINRRCLAWASETSEPTPHWHISSNKATPSLMNLIHSNHHTRPPSPFILYLKWEQSCLMPKSRLKQVGRHVKLEREEQSWRTEQRILGVLAALLNILT